MTPAENRAIEGDCLAILPTLPDDAFQAIIADPPYHNVLDQSWDTQWTAARDYLGWCEQWVAQCLRVLRPDGLFFCFGQPGKREHAFLHLVSRLCALHQFHDLLIWDRVVGYNERRDSFTPAFEMILVLRKSDSPKFIKDAVRETYDEATIQLYLRDKRYKDRDARLAHLTKGKFATSILRVPSLKGTSKEKCGHPSQKPIDLIRKLILCSTEAGDGILDPFLGSGTTAVAAEELDRSWLGIESDPSYLRITESRLAALRSQTPPLL
jgi:DNA modification methylase